MTKSPPSFLLGLLDRDEMSVDVVSSMAARMGGAVAVYFDAATALSSLESSVPDVLVVEPKLLACPLTDFIGALPCLAQGVHLIVMTDLSADDLRSHHLPICWEARLQKPFTFDRFRSVIGTLVSASRYP